MKTRKNCVVHAKKAMSNGRCLVVDRCNFDRDQRAVWYDLARDFDYPVDSIILRPPVSLCISRCQQRKDHETIKPQDASRIVAMVKQQWRMPTQNEKLESFRNYQVVRSPDEFKAALMFHLHQK